MNRFMHAVLLTLGLIALAMSSGCASLLDPGPAPERLLLDPPLDTQVRAALLPVQVQVARPVAGNDLDSDRIAVLSEGRVVRYLGEAKWTSYLPDMLQRSMVDALNVRFNGAGDEENALKAELRMSLDCKRFHYLESKDSALVTIAGQMLDRRSGQVLGTATIEREIPVTGRSIRDVAAALEEGAAQVITELAEWASMVAALYLDEDFEATD